MKKKTIQINALVYPEHIAFLDEQAAKIHGSRTQIIRLLLEDGMKKANFVFQKNLKLDFEKDIRR